ncbi:hypothetical protein MNBD_ALPHA06-1339 [hydrothermal vent metagenome]|uniref:Uncharacterized protein n=1 Tax=hydrothermal vent metagenome TaxID=652676 RepID=A0A3B0SFR5_9ZZZZ
MGIIRFLFREGSPFIFSLAIVVFSLQFLLVDMAPFLAIPENYVGMFVVTMFCLAYLIMQMGMAAFARVGQDGPVVDLFLSLVPLITLVIIVVLKLVGEIPLTLFQSFGLGIAAVVVMMDIIFNTLILFKMNRLANDFVSMS